ncbi:trimeric intracellular cation channel family protein [Aureivirga marina]|uniref:trimeric intracellular cation channel family protein n=1 Tax=Aureivirga marina TaxID=1182451 RepID=UPI0018C90CA4|nr:trimeric intracellular cation channel family protein [Aureivirga marina]
MDFFEVLEILGTSTFAISGALFAIEKRFDPFGVFIIAFVTALGGGTIRDVLIDRNPIGWIHNVNYIYVVIISTIVAIIFRKSIGRFSRSFFLFDAIGLGMFTIIGVKLGFDAKLSPIVCIALGTMSASFGGIVRDLLCNETPIIFRKEIYATASIIGGSVYFLLKTYEHPYIINYLVTIFIVITIRIVAVKYHLSLPTFYKKK